MSGLLKCKLMTNSRTKGANGEREWATLMKEHLGDVDLRRNLDQNREGGYDIAGLDLWAPEIKRCEQFKWAYWRQAERQALAANKRPILAYRANREPWKHYMELTMEEAALVIRESMK